jgi:GTPase SAR1 family protein
MSESDTRSKLIDTVLIDVLGWDEADIRREGHVDSGYFDYKISIAGFSLIIEAKRQYNDLILPNQNKRKCKLNAIYSSNQEVIDQIRHYLDDCGCDIGVVTNGKQYIIAKFFNTNGIPWKENNCIVYNGVEDIINNYVEFWNTLSKESVIRNCGIKQLFDVEISFSKTVLSSILDKDNEIVRNDLSAKLAPFIDKVFGDIFNSNEEDDDIEFIKECYVENKEVIKNKRELRGLFRDTPPKLNEVVKAVNSDSISHQITNEIENYPSQSSNSATPKPIIIIGSRGAGKTTFLNFLFKNESEGNNLQDNPYLFVNLMKYYTGADCVDFENIYKDLLIQFSDKYPQLNINSLEVLERIYIREINQNKKGVWRYSFENNLDEYQKELALFFKEKMRNSQEHFMAINKYLTREIHKRIVVIFDNADQLSDKIQEQVYLNACSLNTQARFGVVISLREGYYYNWRNRPPFNAFICNAYHIAAPDYGQVLQKRLNYLVKNIQFSKTHSFTGSVGDKQYMLNDDKIEEFFTGIEGSLFGAKNAPILDFLRHMSFPNIREGLNLFKTFLISGYTDVSEYVLRVLFNKGDHIITIPIHEFVKTIALENKLYYNHRSSKIQNLLYPSSPNSDYFIKYYLLKVLDEQLSFEGNINKFIGYSDLLKKFLEYGYREDVVNKELESLLTDNFIETDKVLSDISWNNLPEETFSITITAKGHYYITELINRFYYIELILQDTPLFEKEVYDNLVQKFPIPEKSNGKKDMKVRIDVVQLFMDYLETIEKKSNNALLQTKYGKLVDNMLTGGLRNDLNKLSAIADNR